LCIGFRNIPYSILPQSVKKLPEKIIHYRSISKFLKERDNSSGEHSDYALAL